MGSAERYIKLNLNLLFVIKDDVFVLSEHMQNNTCLEQRETKLIVNVLLMTMGKVPASLKCLCLITLLNYHYDQSSRKFISNLLQQIKLFN